MNTSPESAVAQSGRKLAGTRIALGAVLGASFIGQADGFLFTVAAPTVQRDLPASFAEVQLIGAGYVLACAAGLVLGGRLGDRYGHRKIFLGAMVVFALATLACGLGTTPSALIAARLIQGLAAALLIPQELAILRNLYPDPVERAQALGWYGVALGSGVIGGLAGGGVLLYLDPWGLGWRAAFFATLPVCLFAVIAALRTLPESKSSEPLALDAAGALLTALSTGSILVPLVLGSDPTVSLLVWLGIPLGAAALALLAIQQRRDYRRGIAVLYPPRIVRAPAVPATIAAVMLFFAGNAGLFLVFTYYVQAGLGRGPLVAGLALTPLGAGFILGSNLSGRVPLRLGRLTVPLGCLGVAISVSALAAITYAEQGIQLYLLGAAMAATGLAQGFVVAPLSGRILSAVPADDAGTASGIVATATQIGLAIGYTSLGAVYRHILGTEPSTAAKEFNPAPGSTTWALPESMHGIAFLGCALVLVAGALLTAILTSRPPPQT